MRIIGLSGKARAGKDTVCGLIEATLGARGARVVRVGFADALKAECRAQGWNGEKDEAGRALLQNVGLARRAENPRYWIDRLFERIETDPLAPNTIWVITDVRFLNEADAIRAEGGLVWRINRYRLVGSGANVERVPWTNDLTPEQRNHPSETELDIYPFDAVIMNPDELPDLLGFRVGWALAEAGLV